MLIERFVIDGLGCTAYLVACESQRIAAVINPDRDPQPYLDYAQKYRLRITHIFETHLHTDHISGNTELARRSGAAILLHRDAQAAFPHTPLAHGDQVSLGMAQIQVQHSPDHSPEAITLQVSDPRQSETLQIAPSGGLGFTGDNARSIHQHIKSINRRGPSILGEIRPQALTIQQSMPIFQQGAALIDMRSKEDFITKHVPGSIHMGWTPKFSATIAQILPPQAPIVLLLEEAATYREVFFALARIGCEQVMGCLSEGLDTWESLGLPVASGDIEDISPVQLNELLQGGDILLVDVREPFETRFMRIPEAIQIPLGQLNSRIGELDTTRPIAVICQHGSRSQTGAAILGQNGCKKVYNVMGGMSAWVMSSLPIVRG